MECKIFKKVFEYFTIRAPNKGLEPSTTSLHLIRFYIQRRRP